MAVAEHPNIIVIITDTFRRDNLGARARRPVHTPELDRFAAERATELTGLTMSSFPTIPHRTDFASGKGGSRCRRDGQEAENSNGFTRLCRKPTARAVTYKV